MKKAERIRARHKEDRAWLTRCRVRYFRAVRRKVEDEPELIREVALRAVAFGLYGSTVSPRHVRYSVLRQWWRDDEGSDSWEGRNSGFGWGSWMRRYGWLSYQWLHETDAKAIKMRLTA